jgi:hypothetical protein
MLQIEAAPDPLDALPAIDARLVGDLVHRVLQGISPLAWPDAKSLEATVIARAEELLREEGLWLRGYAHVLAAEARPYLDVARELDANDPPVAVRGVETLGEVGIAGDARRIGFRADRVDRTTSGDRLIDFKTGRAISVHKTQETRDKKLTAGIESGTKLQAAAYAFGSGERAEGRYAFLAPGLDPGARIASVSADDGQRKAAFERAVSTLFAALDSGAFVPRLLDDTLAREHRNCAYCDVAEACVRGDSGARARLADWARRAEDDAAHGWWRLGSKTRESEDA